MLPDAQNWASINIEAPVGQKYQRFCGSRNQISEVFLKCLHIKLNVHSTRALTYSSRLTRCCSFDSEWFWQSVWRKIPRVFNKWPHRTHSWNSKAAFYRGQTGRRSSWCVGGRTKRQLFQHKPKLMISSVLLTLSANSAGIKKQIPANTNQSANTHWNRTTVKEKPLVARKHWCCAVAPTEVGGNPDTHAPITASCGFPSCQEQQRRWGQDCFIPGGA